MNPNHLRILSEVTQGEVTDIELHYLKLKNNNYVVSVQEALSALEMLEGEMKPYLRHLDECEIHQPVNVWLILERDDIESLSKGEFDIEVEKLRTCTCGLDQLKNK